MNFKAILLFAVSIFILTSCFQITKEKGSKKEKEDYALEDSQKGEDFYTFLENFNQKPTFQRQRIIFPIEATILDPSEYGMITIIDKIEYQDWFLLDFSYDTSYVSRDRDRYEQLIRLYKDSSIIEHRGIDNGIFANFFFTKKEGKWYLKSFTDVSY